MLVSANDIDIFDEHWWHIDTEGGGNIEVTSDNVHQFVQLYATYLMVDRMEGAVRALREGFEDCFPAHTLGMLTAEDLQLFDFELSPQEMRRLSAVRTD